MILAGASEPFSKIYVPLYVRSLRQEILCRLDTGAPWSVIEPALAQALGLLPGIGEL